MWSVSCYQISKQNSSSSVGFSAYGLSHDRESVRFLCVCERVWTLSSVSCVLPVGLLESHWMNDIWQKSHEASPTSCDLTNEPSLGLWLTWNFPVNVMGTQVKHTGLEWGPWATSQSPLVFFHLTPPILPGPTGSMSRLSIYWCHKYLWASEATAQIALGWGIYNSPCCKLPHNLTFKCPVL